MNAFLEQIKTIGIADWIGIGISLLGLIFIIIILCVCTAALRRNATAMRRARVARVSARTEVLNGWFVIVVENKGNEVADNVKVKVGGSVMKYYYDYITRCRVDDLVSYMLGRKFTLAPSEKREVPLFPVRLPSSGSTFASGSANDDGDVNFASKEESGNVLEINEVFDATDNKILKRVVKKEKKLNRMRALQNEVYRREADKIALKKQNKMRKVNKRNHKLTHTTILDAPDIGLLIKKANISFSVRYTCMGYPMHYNYKYNSLNLRTHQISTSDSMAGIIATQNELLSQIVTLQADMKKLMAKKKKKKKKGTKKK